MKDSAFIVVEGWMVNRCRLRGTELLVFAIVHGFARGRGQQCTCSLRYFAESTGASVSTVQRALRHLEARGLILAQRKKDGCVYRACVGGEGIAAKTLKDVPFQNVENL